MSGSESMEGGFGALTATEARGLLPHELEKVQEATRRLDQAVVVRSLIVELAISALELCEMFDMSVPAAERFLQGVDQPRPVMLELMASELIAIKHHRAAGHIGTAAVLSADNQL